MRASVSAIQVPPCVPSTCTTEGSRSRSSRDADPSTESTPQISSARAPVARVPQDRVVLGLRYSCGSSSTRPSDGTPGALRSRWPRPCGTSARSPGTRRTGGEPGTSTQASPSVTTWKLTQSPNAGMSTAQGPSASVRL